MPKKLCEICEKEITTQNMPRHRKSRLHSLNVRIKEKDIKKKDPKSKK